MQKITSSDEPKKEPVSDEVKFQTLPTSAPAQLVKSPMKTDNSAGADVQSSQEITSSSEPIPEPVSDGPEFKLQQEKEAPPDPDVSGDLQL
jgi:hypothetical protein